MPLTEKAVVAALGARAGKLFLALSGAGRPRDLESFASRIDEYLRFVRDHLELARYAELRDQVDLELARNIGERYKQLLAALDGPEHPHALLVTTGVRYFVTPTDIENDLEERDGFRDDLEVLNYVVQASGLPVEPLEA